MKEKMKPIFVVVGPSGSGKTTLTRESGLKELVSHTTRERRKGEVEGVDYYFVTDKEFDRIPMVEVVAYNGNRYGSSKEEFDKADVVVAEPHGAGQLKKYCSDIGRKCYIIGVICEDSKTYRERMEKRGDTEEKIKQRLENDATVFANLEKLADIVLYSNDRTATHFKEIVASLSKE